MEREFLGWDGTPLQRAADWLAERFGSEMDGVLVALPGARAGRALGERLARRVGPRLRPPRLVTAGLASDALLAVEGVPAGRLVRTLAWKQALAGLDAAALSRLLARPPERRDASAWMRLAEEVRGLFGEVAAEGLEFADVARDGLLAGFEGEQRRWQALSAAQARMSELLEAAGMVDPHLGRLRAIRAGATLPVRAVVLVAVSEMNALLRRALELCEAPVTALVFAPAELADAFDEHGALRPEAWAQRRTSLDASSQWFVVDGPADQARQTARLIAGWRGRYSAEQISIGLADREVGPHLQAVLGELDVVARDAAGMAMRQTRPLVLLEAVARLAEGRLHADLARLVRHVDFEAALRREVPEVAEPVALVDAYHAAHLPWGVDEPWLADREDGRDAAVTRGMRALWSAVRSLLGPLLEAGEPPLAGTAAALRRLLEVVYGAGALDPGHEDDRVLIASLARLGEALAELERLPRAFVEARRVPAAIGLLLETLGQEPVPPAPARAGEPTIELLGWLELALDDAPALVVTGFEEGRVPESLHGDAYLPNRLRQSLGLVDNPKRLARDLYATELLLHSRERVAFVSGRRSAAGDPQVPSRIVFHCADSELAPRMRRFLAGADGARARVQAAAGAVRRELPRRAVLPQLASLAVTDFARYLASPYQFYLERIERLRTLDDRARELDPLGFGNLAHRVLQRFGEHEELREESDGRRIAAFLEQELQRLAGELYGRHPLPAVRLQLDQLGHRLRVFASVQAERRSRGWRIRAVEWSPGEGGYPWEVDGEPIRLRGKIDRVEQNTETGAWAIWDYKTGESVPDPLRQHRARDGRWRDLQLPLYCLLAVDLIGDAMPAEVGYIALPRDAAETSFLGVTRWSRKKNDPETFEQGLESAIDAARDVVRRIRRGELFEPEPFVPRDPILAAIGGVGALAGLEEAAAGESGESEEPEA